MSPNEVLLTILGGIVVLNLSLVAIVTLRDRRRRRRSAPPLGASGRADIRDDPDPRTAAAIEAVLAELSGGSARPTRAPSSPGAVSREPVTVMDPPPQTPRMQQAALMMPWATWMDGPGTNGREPSAEPISAGRIQTRAWSPAGLAGAATWDRAVREEQTRVAHFGRPVTVVMAELPHLDDIARRLGRAVADRVVEETARVLVAQGRAEDRIAWLGEARFGVLLAEAEEIRAWDYVGRVRAASDSWLEAAGLSIRLSLGWAGASEGGDVMAAAAIAQELMHDGAHRASVGSR